MNLTLHVWRQAGPKALGRLVRYEAKDVSPDMSFLEMLDVVNDRLTLEGQEPIAFEHDCREGICGSCGFMINGQPHGPLGNTTVCQLHMREFSDGDELYLEPWRAEPFPVLRDLVVDRAPFDRIIQAGGYISVNTGSATDANEIPIGKETADHAMDAATCIGCGACVAACPNSAAQLFTSAKVSHLAMLPQGAPERASRAISMIRQMEEEGFGGCTNYAECEAACPKGIGIEFIARMNREWLKARLTRQD